METHTIGEVARMSGITVRALHHYDDIGLLSPSGRTESGYRLYDDRDIDRLRDILAFRELGLGLDEVAEALASSDGSHATLVRCSGGGISPILCEVFLFLSQGPSPWQGKAHMPAPAAPYSP